MPLFKLLAMYVLIHLKMHTRAFN